MNITVTENVSAVTFNNVPLYKTIMEDTLTAVAEAGINIDMISTSEIRISVVTEQSRLDDAVRVIHTAFGLDAEQTEAVVYGGTGR